MLNFNVEEKYLEQIKAGLKTIEGRLAKDKYLQLKKGELVIFNRTYVTAIEKVVVYASFREMLETVGLEKILPTILSIEEGEQIYRQFYTFAEEKQYGVVGIFLQQIT